jgi:hypothetical protein
MVQPSPTARFGTPVSVWSTHTVVRVSGVAQPTVTAVCVVAVLPPA